MPPCVLVVEDDDSVRANLTRCLRVRCGTDVHGARDGSEALHVLSTRSYGVLLLDLAMPHMSGIDLLHSLKTMCADPSVRRLVTVPRVLVVTGAPAGEIRDADLISQFAPLVAGVHRKPVDVVRLAADVERLLGEARTEGASRGD